MSKLEEEFESSKKLEAFSQQLIAEQNALREHRAHILAETEKLRKIANTYRESVEQFEAAALAFIAEVDNLKRFKELVEMTETLVETLRK